MQAADISTSSLIGFDATFKTPRIFGSIGRSSQADSSGFYGLAKRVKIDSLEPSIGQSIDFKDSIRLSAMAKIAPRIVDIRDTQIQGLGNYNSYKPDPKEFDVKPLSFYVSAELGAYSPELYGFRTGIVIAYSISLGEDCRREVETTSLCNALVAHEYNAIALSYTYGDHNLRFMIRDYRTAAINPTVIDPKISTSLGYFYSL